MENRAVVGNTEEGIGDTAGVGANKKYWWANQYYLECGTLVSPRGAGIGRLFTSELE